jgi:hypothetical protein
MIPVSARNTAFVGSSDQGGRGDGVQIMVHKGHPISATCSATASPSSM